jgi:hypothetical protein
MAGAVPWGRHELKNTSIITTNSDETGARIFIFELEFNIRVIPLEITIGIF